MSRIDAQAIGAMPENSAFAGGLIDDDIGALVGATGADLDVVQIHPGFAQAGHLDATAFVVTHGSDVFRSQTELATGRESAGDLAPRAQDFLLKSDLSA